MPRPRNAVPEIKRHGPLGCRVWLDGDWRYLGEHGSAEAQAKYDTLLAKYLANGRRLPRDAADTDGPITVYAVMAEYRREIDSRPKQLGRWRHLCTLMDDEYGDLSADEFGPRKLSDVRDLLLLPTGGKRKRLARKTVNEYIQRIVKMFEHAVSRELVDVNTLLRLQTLAPIRPGQTQAPEAKRRQPAVIEHVRAAAKHLSPQAKGIITILAATGMRPSEVFNIRPCDIDRSGNEWFYRPEHHKTEAHGIVKAVPIVGEARDALTPFLLRPSADCCFSPAESAQWHRDQRSANRTTPKNCGNRVGTNRKPNPKRAPGKKFTKDGLNWAVKRACEKAGVPKWTPYQLRHLAATAVADAIGLDGARALLSHASTRMTENYVKQKQDEAKAIEAARVAPSVG